MERARFFVDGFNFYHSLIENRGFRKEAALDNYDAAILVANDTDLVPSIKAVKEVSPKKKVGVLFPFGRWSSELHHLCDFTKKTNEKDLSNCQFPDQISLPSGAIIKRPNTYN